MYDGYLAVNDIEIINAERAEAYILGALGSTIELKCKTDGLRSVIGRAEAYSTPALDGAPWYIASNPASGQFLGLFPTGMTGASDSTRTTSLTELTGDGGVHSLPRHASKEIRFKAVAFATTEEGLEVGLTWLKSVLTDPDCETVFGLGCTGRDAHMIFALPAQGRANTHDLMRTFYEVEVIDGPKKVQNITVKNGYAREIEFILSAGKPWAFKPMQSVGTLNMATSTSYTDPEGEDCSLSGDAYADFINDPFFTAIKKPPRPPIMKPPNILKIASWRRHRLNIPAAIGEEWGRTVPFVTVRNGAEPMQQLRLRFWHPDTTDTCGYDGEFLISYLPPGATMTLDGIRREVTVRLADGRTVPGTHLLFGSDGRPFMWPEMSCDTAYSMTADIMPGNLAVNVDLSVAVRQ